METGKCVAILSPVTPRSIQALRDEMGFDDAVVARKIPNSDARSVLVS
jgi:hypothetical protein